MRIVTCVKRELRCSNYRFGLIACFINFILGIVSALIGGSASLYRYLLLPRFAPAPFVFIFVWSIIYIVMGMAFGMIFSHCRCGGTRSRLYTIFLYALLSLWLFLWYPIFFGSKLISLALVDAALILATSLFVMRNFLKHSIFAALLMIPCTLWFAFSFLLNFCILLLN